MLDYYWQYNFSLYAVIEKDTKQLIGFCGLLPWKFEAKTEIEIAYRLAKVYWGRGFATEAATAVRNYAWQKLGIKQLFCIIVPENMRSIRTDNSWTQMSDVHLFGNIRTGIVYYNSLRILSRFNS
ncbi:hypothetical protein H1P_2550001 [Hyella patelloides LEGE 07179]|uniref:N-acetyltransferase domain-containing protein n=1 Tax=Hyella patelloides LEGE 07179 TaxID=945734 RepID=A0A563VS59_9CYAN|nr:GNAT family N-acetyltransferase [Hyella patelloides]VEP14290.1 hypothetical protein H1P_2550001 [Hyella patelloides LEGE 07179]